MTKKDIFGQIKKKSSLLCVGLDSDIEKIPAFLLKQPEPVFAFNKQIIDATSKYAIAYKFNTAFYETLGPAGWLEFQKTIEYIRKVDNEIFIIADAKRGDIGNTSKMYARAFFDTYECDAITVAPYMGEDSVSPFLENKDKWIILLALTSNQGAEDFQFLEITDSGKKLYEQVIIKSGHWQQAHNLMYVVGATKASYINGIREIVPDSFLLIPGVGAQGGDLHEVVKNGITDTGGLIVNSSRKIIFADNSKEFYKFAGKEAKKLQEQMKQLLDRYL